MNEEERFENRMREFCRLRQAEICTTPQFDERVLGSADASRQEGSEHAEAGRPRRYWGIVVTVAASGVILGGLLVLWLSYRVAMPVYAAEIIQAVQKVQTVHMMVDFYRQGEFECWLRFDGDPDKPTHVWLGALEGSLIKVCSPDGVFLFNPVSRRLLYCSRDERGQAWIPRFGNFLENTLRYASRSNAVNFDGMNLSQASEPVPIRIETRKRVQQFLVDPATRLPVSFATVRDDDPMEKVREVLAIRNLKWIRYNETPPAGIFETPKDAVVVTKEIDCLVGPDSGLVVEGMTPQEACLAIVERAGQAWVNLDADTLRKLDLTFRTWPPEFWEQARQWKASGQLPDRYAITGAAYQDGDVWYVPFEYQGGSIGSKKQTPMIKFYQFDGKTYGFIIGTKERGVVD